jgi:sporulation protein YlmC with PRC-barrel domain
MIDPDVRHAVDRSRRQPVQLNSPESIPGRACPPPSQPVQPADSKDWRDPGVGTTQHMTDTVQFTIGAEVSCTDGVCGKVSRVVVDPVARAVTHLVVDPKHRRDLGRLVPLDLVDATTGEIWLRCTLAGFGKLDAAEETQFLPGNYPGYGPDQALSWPYYGLGGLDTADMGLGVGNAFQPVIYDTIPSGEISVRRGDQVHATDGAIGRVQGLVIDPRNRRVTHVLLQEGHLRGRKEVAIPISSVTHVDDGIRINITKQEVEHLPAVDIDHLNG